MKIPFIKESFGPFRIAAVKVVDAQAKHESGVTMQEHLLALGALYEAERTPSSTAEKLFWNEKDAKGKLVRGSFRRNMIPATEDARSAIEAAFVAAGYEDVKVSVREVSEQGPAWKVKVAGMVGGVALGLDAESVRAAIAKLIAEQGLDAGEVMTYAKSKGMPEPVAEAPKGKGKKAA